MDATPLFDEQSIERQRALIAAYIVTYPNESMEAFGYMDNELHANKIASLIMDLITPAKLASLSDAVFLSARQMFSDGIQDRIDTLFDDYCNEYGIYEGGRDTPAELIGFRRDQ